MTVADFLALAPRRLATVSGSPALEAQMLAAHALRTERAFILAHPEAELPELAMEALLQRREAGEPLAYILGWREFYGRRFSVRPGVLIPRQETETVVEACLRLEGVRTVLDVGTGSGCIAVTLALERPDWQVLAGDVSEAALEVARENAEALGANVEFRRSDLFEAFAGEKFDAIVSNPPYVAREEELPHEVRAYEPEQALYADEAGTALYRRLAEEAPAHLNSGGRLALELGHRSLAPVSKILESRGWRVEAVLKDLSGVDRCLVAGLP